MRRVYISDLHLEDPAAPAFMRFQEFMTVESQSVDEIYILGDLVEMWIGDDDDSAAATALAEILRTTTRRCSVFLMHGNRDFLFGQDFCSNAGIEIISDPYITADNIMLSHGDALCVDDEEYQTVRTTLRSVAWQQDILAKTLTERKAFGQALRMQSKSSNANKPGNIMDVNQTETDAQVAAHEAHTLIHGHTHRPGVHRRPGYTRMVTGAWEQCGWVCRQNDDDLRLECFSLARRYGT